MTNDPWIDRLSEYVDGELDDVTSAALEGHLVTCDECRAITEDLRQIAIRARALPERRPAATSGPRSNARSTGRMSSRSRHGGADCTSHGRASRRPASSSGLPPAAPPSATSTGSSRIASR